LCRACIENDAIGMRAELEEPRASHPPAPEAGTAPSTPQCEGYGNVPCAEHDGPRCRDHSGAVDVIGPSGVKVATFYGGDLYAHRFIESCTGATGHRWRFVYHPPAASAPSAAGDLTPSPPCELTRLRERLAMAKLYVVMGEGTTIAQQPGGDQSWHVTRGCDDGGVEALSRDGRWLRFNHFKGPGAECAFPTADAAFEALARVTNG
jgi:hypothetical protein